MPDVHAGKGCVVGLAANLGDKVIPNIVGVDIGCGMLTVNLGNIDIDFAKLDRFIRDEIPSGMEVNDKQTSNVTSILLCREHLYNTDRLNRSMGTLGGGNHFIEIDVDESNGDKYLVIHTGSRNLGKQVCEYYQEHAIMETNNYPYVEKRNALIHDYHMSGRSKEIEAALASLKKEFEETKVPDALCYLEGKMRDDYLRDMSYCVTFAEMNRQEIARRIMRGMGWAKQYQFDTKHNYIDLWSGITRKGAIYAGEGETVLIPMNMRDGCIIGVGKGNPDWNCSAPHGAGGILSRKEAKSTLTLDGYRNTMSGIYTTSVSAETLDEAPQAYKPMQEIIDCIGDTIAIKTIIKPVYNYKAAD